MMVISMHFPMQIDKKWYCLEITCIAMTSFESITQRMICVALKILSTPALIPLSWFWPMKTTEMRNRIPTGMPKYSAYFTPM